MHNCMAYIDCLAETSQFVNVDNVAYRPYSVYKDNLYYKIVFCHF